MGAQHKPKLAGGNLLEYPVTVVGVLGLWSFIAGGILRGAGHGHTQIHTIRTPGWEGRESRGGGRQQDEDDKQK